MYFKYYLNVGRIKDAIPYLVKILHMNPYEYTVLYTLIQILGTVETGEAIGEFLKKLYNFNNLKDQMVLVQITKKVGNTDLYNYIVSRVSDEVKQKLAVI